MPHKYHVYFVTNKTNTALYIGVTSNIEKRIYEHKNEAHEGFSKKYKCKKLVYTEEYQDIKEAIAREKQLKKWVRRKKNALIETINPKWLDLSTAEQSSYAQDDNALGNPRYIRQLALPEIGIKQQQRIAKTHIAIIGAGGLGCAALPYLAGAGIGHITIYDDDTISRSNLHRQTLYQDAQTGQSKAEAAANYARALNPDITVHCHPERLALKDLDSSAQALQDDIDLILDGSDNFETKTLLNAISIKTNTPLISASVNQWAGQIGIFAGFAANKPCYHCLFPALPTDARNCNEAGILGTSAGITGLYQAHIALGYLIGLPEFTPGRILSFDFKTLRMQNLNLDKDKSCPHCKDSKQEWTRQEKTMPDLISMKDLSEIDHLIVDVRTDQEVANDPIPSAPENYIHMELQTVPTRHEELPKDKRLAFVCAGNVRSVQAAEYLEGLGYDNVIVLDKFSI